ncbi:DUF6234 family protein [Streptomyces sp. NBC_00083]|uniref:DUF6234 family protein n=1 Tax=Streptomyces sp. NBC_00083 TaxID=2975647 RepID=UPI0022531DBE|nr:DUF6234 family protein [Streptomyces sp. NBC_00083]MCX5387279.1 DUF6234 family protein [Streptomyces sp. NBC_00083]
MTQARPELLPRRRRRRPWSKKTSLGTDIAAAMLLLLTEILLGVRKVFVDSMEAWAAEGRQTNTAASDLASIRWLEYFLAAIVLLAIIATVCLAPCTAVLQFLAAGAVALMLVLAQHSYHQAHPDPPPKPDPHYTPCYSGSHRCH